MSIKVKIIIIAIFSLVVTATIGLILFQNSLTVKKEIEKQGIASEIRNKVFELAVLRNEYFLYREERPITQLRVASESVERLFVQASSVFISADEQVLLGRIVDNKKFIDQTLSQIVANFKNQGAIPSSDSTGSPRVISEELEKRLVSQILIKSQENFTIASQLTNASRSRVIESQNKTTIFVLVFFAISIIVILVMMSLIWFSIAKPLVALKESALRIASLDFSTTTTTTTTGSNDEIGQLARAFNTMVVKLKESYTGLEGKVQERTAQLDAANQQLRATNQQLDAGTQQLRAANQQLASAGKVLKEKVTALEVFNKAAVGRELKMIELKKEIEGLRKQNKKV